MRPVALIACDKIIIDKDGAHSLINVMLNAKVEMQEIQSGQTTSRPIPPDAVAPTQWWIYTAWEPSVEDIDRVFEQVYQIFWPNGDKLLESSLSFVLHEEKMWQTTFFIGGFPVGQQGKVRIVTWLHFEGRRTSEIAETFITVSHVELKNSMQSVQP
jgi:hypothetical protein